MRYNTLQATIRHVGVGAGVRKRGRWGAQAWALGRAGRRAHGRVGGMGAGALGGTGAGALGVGARDSRRLERMPGRAGARWLRCDTAALRCDTAGGLGHDTARPPTTRPRARGLCA